MALVKESLKGQLLAIQNSQPNTLVLSATKWSTAFFSYFSAAMAGALTPLPSLVQTSLQASFLASMQANKFIENLGSDLNKWISPVSWVGPGFIPVNPTIIAGPLISKPLGDAILNGADMADTISTAVDTWAKTITVSATTTSVPPVTSIIPVS